MKLLVHLYPPLNNSAGRDRLELSFGSEVTIQSVIDHLIGRFGPEFRRNLYDDRDRFISAWCVFVNNQPVHLNIPDALLTHLNDGDELLCWRWPVGDH